MISNSSNPRTGMVLLVFSLIISPLWGESWTVGDQVYHDVVVRDVNPETVVILHRSGLGSLPLKLLPQDLQERFGYAPDKAQAHREVQKQEAAAAQERLKAQQDALRAASPQSVKRISGGRMDAILRQIDQPAQISERVDLRERFAEHGLHPRNQGRRPSCAVFAVASAFAFALAESGRSGDLSEEYLLWSTVQYLEQHPAPIHGQTFDGEDPGDIGFSLMSVVQAAQLYGVALSQEMPNRLGGRFAELETPPEALIEHSRSQRLPRAARLGGDSSNEQKINLILKVLNAGWPVTIGTRWPSNHTLRRSALVDKQAPLPDYAHAITLIGYAAPGGNLDECIFIFRNSWGINWGIAGHGMISYNYLLEHLQDAIVIDVEAGK
ncbi:MAG: hypothetical protein EA353_04935 [Puniceicoccaceae bacterium]|nr:MAG: hypothetical protein EA353_04935 [Puniceicoccaceae bacterium]